MLPRIHRNAVEVAIEENRGSLGPADGPLVELLRTLADQVDEAPPGTRLAAAYLSAISALHRRVAGGRAPQTTGTLHRLQEEARNRKRAS